MPKKTTLAQKFAGMFRLFMDKNGPPNAEDMMDAWLKRNGKSRADIPSILAQAVADDAADQPPPPPPPPTEPPTEPSLIIGLVEALIKRHVFISADEILIAALWTLHSWVFDRFRHTPRLLIIAYSGFGKSELIDTINELCRNPHSVSGITPAAIYYQLHEDPLTTFLLDEGDNYEVAANRKLRRIFNSGYKRTGAESLTNVNRQAVRFSTFAPIALAAIGNLPFPWRRRSFLIRMRPSPHNLPLFDSSAADFRAVREEIRRWAATCQLKPDPAIPASLRHGLANNARVLLAIADDLKCGERARSAIVAHYAARAHENIPVDLLNNIRAVYQSLHIDRSSRDNLLRELQGLENGQWRNYRGLEGNKPPHPLTGSELSQILFDAFGIHIKNIWPRPRQPTSTSAQGYYRSQFEEGLESDVDDSNTKPSKVIGLPRP
ncbi:unnamed protein product [uncultured bacterium]|nr:unnamed protein product [uncultured bacterium]